MRLPATITIAVLVLQRIFVGEYLCSLDISDSLTGSSSHIYLHLYILIFKYCQCVAIFHIIISKCQTKGDYPSAPKTAPYTLAYVQCPLTLTNPD